MRVIYIESPVSFHHAERVQTALADARLRNQVDDTVLFLQHQPVVTMGVAAKGGHVLTTQEQLAARGIELVRCSRGGDVTYHGPGQAIMYPVMKLTGADADAHRYLRKLEEVAIRTAAGFGVAAFRRRGLTGVWTEAGKLAAIGIRLRRWVTTHGLSLNVDLDLAAFDLIVPCGLAGERVTSLRALLGDRCPSTREVCTGMAGHLGAVFGGRVEPAVVLASLPEDLLPLYTPLTNRR